jgi:DNA replication protein DnaC
VEPIGDILKRLAVQRNIQPANTGTSSNRKQEPSCPRCRDAGFLRPDVPVDDPRFGELIPCECRLREVQERRTRQLLERSNLGALTSMTFDTFMVDEPQRTAYQRALQFAQHPDGWLVIMGWYGTGKTHLAAAIGNYRLSLGSPALFMVVPDLLDHLRSAYAPGSELGYDDFFEGVRQAPLLILDDLGTQISTPWAQEKLYQLFNHRYIYRLATVITTNHSLDEIGGRLASRMSDPQISYCVTIDSGDFRGGGEKARGPGTAPDRAQRRRQGRGEVSYTDRPV